MADIITIKKQIAELEEQLKQEISKKKAEKIKEVLEIISTYGITAKELGFSSNHPFEPAEGKKERAKPEPKYLLRLNDKEITWSGRGRMPTEMKSWLESGGASLDDLLIKKS